MATVPPVPTDLYTISMDELRRLASQPVEPIDTTSNPDPQPDTEWTSEQPRDEQGRFVSPEPEPVVETPADEQILVRDEIDLGEGGGVQVFEGVGATEAEARADQVAKLLEAQRNATKKIRELAHPKEIVQPPAGPTPEEEFLLSQRVMNGEISAVLKETLTREFGMEPTEIKRRLEVAAQFEQSRAEDAAVNAFIAANPDYHQCQQNGTRLLKFLKINGMERTQENIQAAYNELKTDGLVVPKPAVEPAAAARPRSSGLSTRRSSPPPAQKSEADLLREAYSMPLDKLREKIYGR